MIYGRAWIWLITIIAASLRVWKLGEWGFWEDEVYTLQDAQVLPQLTSVSFLPYLLVRICIEVFGVNEWSARMAPCLIGIVSIPVFYYLVKEAIGRDEGLLAALLAAFSPWQLFWSQSARSYSLTFLFAAIAAFSFYLALEKDSLKLIFNSIFFMGLTALSHVLSVFLLVGLFGYLLVMYMLKVELPKGFTKRNIFIFFAPFVLLATLLLYPPIGGYFFSGWGRNEWGRDPLYIVLTLIYGVGIPAFIVALSAPLIFLKNLDRRAIFLISYALMPLLSFLFLSAFFNVAGYYLFFTLPAYLTLSAWGSAHLLRRVGGVDRIIGLAFVGMIIGSYLAQDYSYYRFENGGRPKWKEAIKTIEIRMHSDDEVVASSPRMINYYLPKSKITFIKDVLINEQDFKLKWSKAKNGTWFVIDEATFQVIDPEGTFRSWVYDNCRLVASFPIFVRYMNRAISVYRLDIS